MTKRTLLTALLRQYRILRFIVRRLHFLNFAFCTHQLSHCKRNFSENVSLVPRFISYRSRTYQKPLQIMPVTVVVYMMTTKWHDTQFSELISYIMATHKRQKIQLLTHPQCDLKVLPSSKYQWDAVSSSEFVSHRYFKDCHTFKSNWVWAYTCVS